jgi:hypothetical protein
LDVTSAWTIERWKNIFAQDVPALNNELQTAGLPRINIAP